MFPLLPLLLAVLTDEREQRRTTARLNEVRNRLGIREEVRRGGLRARTEYALRLLPRVPFLGVPEHRKSHPDLLGVVSDGGRPPTGVPASVVAAFYRGWEEHVVDDHGDDGAWRYTLRRFFNVTWGDYSQHLLDSGVVNPPWSDPADPAKLFAEWRARLPLPVPQGDTSTALDPWIPWWARQLAVAYERTDAKRRSGVRGDEANVGFVIGDMETKFKENLPAILDWAREERPDIGRMDLDAVVAATQEWHDGFVGDPGFRQRAPVGIPVRTFGDGARIDRLVTAFSLDAEGTAMGHCVGGRWSEVRDGRSAIFTYRRPDGVPELTLEVKPAFEDRASPGPAPNPHAVWVPSPPGFGPAPDRTLYPDAGAWVWYRYGEVKGPENKPTEDALAGRRMAKFMLDLGVLDMGSDAPAYLAIEGSSPDQIVLPDLVHAALDAISDDDQSKLEGADQHDPGVLGRIARSTQKELGIDPEEARHVLGMIAEHAHGIRDGRDRVDWLGALSWKAEQADWSDPEDETVLRVREAIGDDTLDEIIEECRDEDDEIDETRLVVRVRRYLDQDFEWTQSETWKHVEAEAADLMTLFRRMTSVDAYWNDASRSVGRDVTFWERGEDRAFSFGYRSDDSDNGMPEYVVVPERGSVDSLQDLRHHWIEGKTLIDAMSRASAFLSLTESVARLRKALEADDGVEVTEVFPLDAVEAHPTVLGFLEYVSKTRPEVMDRGAVRTLAQLRTQGR
jgi:hypothetical protein